MAAMPLTPDMLVDALYGCLLLREADPSGREDKIARLSDGSASPADIIREIVGAAEFVHSLPDLLASTGGNEHRRFTNDVSQYGEVWELIRLWVNRAALTRIVVDVGARGRQRSNSYDLLREFGWRGVLVEANPALIDTVAAEFAGLDLTLLCCAVSDYDGEATFTIGVNDDVSSLTPELAGDWGPTRGAVTVRVRRLAALLREQDVPHRFDLLSLDIEGEDIKVLNDLIGTSDFRPEWVVIEASDDFAVRSLDDAPFSQGVKDAYAIAGQTRSNLLLQRRGD